MFACDVYNCFFYYEPAHKLGFARCGLYGLNGLLYIHNATVSHSLRRRHARAVDLDDAIIAHSPHQNASV
jgi:hypothetical protein